MVGGGIFAVLGLAVGVGGGGTFVAFFIAGMVALLTTYSYARLSVAIPSSGGTVAFVNEAFGEGRVAGALSVLLWLSYIVTVALYAFAFGSYATTFLSTPAQSVGLHVMITAVVVVMAVVNVFSAKLIGATEKYIVAAKVAILVAFVAVALFHTDFADGRPFPVAGGRFAHRRRDAHLRGLRRLRADRQRRRRREGPETDDPPGALCLGDLHHRALRPGRDRDGRAPVARPDRRCRGLRVGRGGRGGLGPDRLRRHRRGRPPVHGIGHQRNVVRDLASHRGDRRRRRSPHLPRAKDRRQTDPRAPPDCRALLCWSPTSCPSKRSPHWPAPVS